MEQTLTDNFIVQIMSADDTFKIYIGKHPDQKAEFAARAPDLFKQALAEGLPFFSMPVWQGTMSERNLVSFASSLQALKDDEDTRHMILTTVMPRLPAIVANHNGDRIGQYLRTECVDMPEMYIDQGLAVLLGLGKARISAYIVDHMQNLDIRANERDGADAERLTEKNLDGALAAMPQLVAQGDIFSVQLLTEYLLSSRDGPAVEKIIAAVAPLLSAMGQEPESMCEILDVLAKGTFHAMAAWSENGQALRKTLLQEGIKAIPVAVKAALFDEGTQFPFFNTLLRLAGDDRQAINEIITKGFAALPDAGPEEGRIYHTLAAAARNLGLKGAFIVSAADAVPALATGTTPAPMPVPSDPRP